MRRSPSQSALPAAPSTPPAQPVCGRMVRPGPPAGLREARWLIDALQQELDQLNPLGRSVVRVRRRRAWPEPQPVHEVQVIAGTLHATHRDADLERAILGAFQEVFDVLEPIEPSRPLH